MLGHALILVFESGDRRHPQLYSEMRANMGYTTEENLPKRCTLEPWNILVKCCSSLTYLKVSGHLFNANHFKFSPLFSFYSSP